MFKVTVALVFACFVGIHSMPYGAWSTCQGLTCFDLVSKIIDKMKDIQFEKGTHAKNLTNCTLIKCNLNIFTKELHKKWNCKEPMDNSDTCLFYKQLKCIPYNCKVPNTTCEEPDENSDTHNLKDAMTTFLKTVSRHLKSREVKGNSCENLHA